MKRIFWLGLFLSVFFVAGAQNTNSFVKDMQWGVDYQIHLTLSNDSSYAVNIEDLVHSRTLGTDTVLKDFVYYPVMLARDFVDKLKENYDPGKDTMLVNTTAKPTTLWSALHSSLGGGWVHFVNCLLYSLETRYLSLTAPLMERPKSHWKPRPVTQTYLRTKKWKYYVPVNQKQAQKEYYLKEKENSLANIKDVPEDFIKLFLETNDKEYKKITEKHDIQKQARIDLVRLLVGANYLGNAQISYIKTMVLKAALQYSYNQLPSIIVFDDLDAAVIMSLNENGYHLEKIVFRNAGSLSDDEKLTRQQTIEQSIRIINKVNQKIFEERLKKYYQ